MSPAFRYAGPPMTLGNMRANGVRRLDASCWECHPKAVLEVDGYGDDVPVPSFGPRLVCNKVGLLAAMPGRIGRTRGAGWCQAGWALTFFAFRKYIAKLPDRARSEARRFRRLEESQKRAKRRKE
jgi:hypothetical protein